MLDKIRMLNAQVKSTSLGPEDHNIFTSYLHLDFGGSGQGFGGLCLDGESNEFKPLKYLSGILKVLGVRSWEKIPCRHCRALQEHTKVYSIGHIVEDMWLHPQTQEVVKYDDLPNNIKPGGDST